MGSIRGKLRSQRGASILLALLFLLACMMVAASVLMAAASNAYESNVMLGTVAGGDLLLG